MKFTLHSKPNKNDPSLAIISMALVQSEIYWICSVLYCFFHSGLTTQQSLVKSTKRIYNRTRSHSAPSSPSKNSLTSDDYVQLDKAEKELALRRSSLPLPACIEIIDTNIRQRPSVHDERTGTTCPPIWWQKTRVKLGRAPVHVDAKTMIDSSKLIEPVSITPPPSSIHFEEPVLPKRSNTVIPVSTIVNNPSPPTLPRPTLPVSQTPSAHNSFSSPSIYTISEEDLTFSQQASEISVPIISEHQQQQRVKKFMSKLNTALKSIPHHRRNNSTDSKKSLKKSLYK